MIGEKIINNQEIEYVIQDEIDRGEFGVVYLVRDTKRHLFADKNVVG